MKRSLALAVCGFSLVLALVGGWLADRQFTAALDTLADQAVLQHQRNLFGYADTLQEVKADDSPHMILADDSGTRYVNASDKAFAGQLYFDRQRLIVGSIPCTFALLDQTGRVIYSKLPDTIPESELAALKDADTTTMRLCGQTLLLCDQVAGASGQRVWVWMVTALDAGSAYAVRTVTLRQWFLLQAVLTLAALLMVHHTTALQQLNDRQSRFVADLTHELKTPLTSVIGYLTLLRDEPQISPEIRARYTGIALEKAERLEDLINEFFDITRFNLSRLELERQSVDLTRMLEQVASEFRPIFAESGLSCSLDLPPKLHYSCDPDKLARVFDNLLRNASYYSLPDSTVEIAGRIEAGKIVLTFSNAGKNIPQEKLDRIFEQFFRLDSSRATRTGGAGLGLAIAKEIVELHGGTIRADSTEDRITFTICLPSDHSEAP